MFYRKTKAENEIIVDGLKPEEIEKDFLGDYEGEFEMIGNMIIGERIGKTHIRFGINNEYEEHIKALDIEYDS